MRDLSVFGRKCMPSNKLGISVVVPVFNEENNVTTLAKRISNTLAHIEHEIVFVNDGSTDETAVILEGLCSNFPNIIHIQKAKNEGIPEAWKTGVNSSRNELILLIDGDLQNPPEYISKMYDKLIRENLDAVQATRSEIDRIKDHRYLFSRSLNLLLNVTFNQTAKDSKSGFLLAYREVLSDVLAYKENYFFFQNFIGVRLRYLEYAVGEIETLFQPRVSGESFLRGFESAKAAILATRDFPAAKREQKSSTKLNENLSKLTPNSRGLKSKVHELIYFATFPWHTWVVSRQTMNKLNQLRAVEFNSKKAISEYQLVKFKSLINHAYRTTDYYKSKFDEAGIAPRSIKNLDDIVKLPLLSKTDVRENIHFSMFSSSANKKKLHRISTSGSTGEPFVCYADQHQLEVRFATTIRAYEMAGWNFGDRQLRLWHQKLGMSRRMVFKEKFDAFLMRREFVPAFEMTEKSIATLIAKINKKKPKIIDGYAESLNFLAKFNEKLTYSPKAVISSAQELTEDTRTSIEKLFNCKVIDKYGSREFSGIAYQCLEGEFHHVQEESYIVEILVEGRTALPGEVGEIVVTDLNNYSVPMIRYRIGDLAEAIEQHECRCGRKTNMIGKIYGRTQALIHCSNGVWLPGTFFAHFFKDYSAFIRHYQVIQEDFGKFKLKIVPTDIYSEENSLTLIERLREHAGELTLISVELVTEIPLVKTGKRTPVVSKLKYDFQEISKVSVKSQI